MIEFRIGLINGKFGYGADSWQALKAAVGSKKAHLIASQIARVNTETGEVIAKNGVTIAYIEKRQKP